MSPAHRAPFSLRRWLALLFRQPPQGLYRRPCLYQSGDRMEIEHFCTVLFLSLIHISEPTGRS